MKRIIGIHIKMSFAGMVIATVLVFLPLTGCKKGYELPSEPVIPLIDRSVVPLSDNSIVSDNYVSENEADLSSVSENNHDEAIIKAYNSISGNRQIRTISENEPVSQNKQIWVNEEVSGNEIVSDYMTAVNSEEEDRFPMLHLEGKVMEKVVYVSSIQLSEEQLEKLSNYFNLDDVNPYLQQTYVIPVDFDENAKSIPVNIKCIAGTYDSNGLYSLFYKKGDDNTLWNVVMRNSDGKYIFHSNGRCSDR